MSNPPPIEVPLVSDAHMEANNKIIVSLTDYSPMPVRLTLVPGEKFSNHAATWVLSVGDAENLVTVLQYQLAELARLSREKVTNGIV